MRLCKSVLGLAVVGLMLIASRAAAQEREHLQVGMYGDYFRVSQTDTSSLEV
jgi:hypothetical protein